MTGYRSFLTMSILLAAAITLLIVGLGYGARALTVNGAVAAAAVGILVLSGTGFSGLWGLGAFFVTSSLLSRKSSRYEPAWLDTPGHQRNASQVMANGGIAAIGGLTGLAGHTGLGLAIAICALAAAAADTWATSIGMSSIGEPVDIWRWKRVAKGTSGGVSLRGTLGGVAGAVTVAVAPLVGGAPVALAAVALAAGVAGMVADSLLGAILQGRFFCDACGQPSERRIHRCGAATRRTGGLAGLGNDGVNALANALAGMIGAAWWTLR
jgi:uncharacterized protein (TIGR00297 family)